MLRINFKFILIISLMTIVGGSTHAYSKTMTYTYDAFNRLQKAEYVGALPV